MRRSGTIGLVLTLVGLASVGCQNKMYDENMALHRQNRELQAENDRIKQELSSRPDAAQLAAMQQQIADRDAKINDLQNQLRTPAPGQSAGGGIEGIEVTRNDREGTVTVNLPGDVLFDSGQAELKPSARATLNKVVAALKRDYAGKKIMVDGYTDTDPINRTKDKYEDNLDLSASRARSVAKYLTQQGIDSKQVGVRAMGDTKPRSSKAASRRVEIVVAMR